MSRTFHVPPVWPPPPAGWEPAADWRPDPSWPPPPPGWVFWTDTALVPGSGTPLPPVAPARTALLRFGWLIALVAGVVAYLVVLFAMVSTRNLNLFPSLLFIGSLTVPLSVLLLAYSAAHRAAADHTGLVALTALIGGLIGVTTAATLEYATLKALPALGMLAVGVIEEVAKLIMPVLVFALARRRTPGMGLILGVASGTGFAALETMGYGLSALLETGGGLGAVDATLLLRALLAPAGHVAWTGLTCWALWRLGETPRPRWAGLVFAVAFVGAVVLHAAWDGTASLALHVAIAVVSVTILLVLMVVSSRRRPRPPA